jgi:hypothetical protein
MTDLGPVGSRGQEAGKDHLASADSETTLLWYARADWASQDQDDPKLGVIDRFRSMPMARSAVLIGRTVADLVRNVLIIVLMIIVGYIIGFRFQAGVARVDLRPSRQTESRASMPAQTARSPNRWVILQLRTARAQLPDKAREVM